MDAGLDLDRALDVALEAARRARVTTLALFRREKVVFTKADRSPVTRADREAEAAILATIRSAYPDHGFLAEESGQVLTEGPRWIVDPIDGTRGYIRGVPYWGTLIALEAGERRLLGVMDLPALDQTYHAVTGRGAWCGPERLTVSAVERPEEATLVLGEIPLLLAGSYGPAFAGLVRRFNLVRCYGDCYAATFLLRGLAEVWVEPEVKAWDLAAVEVLVTEAGGRFTSLAGCATCHAGSGLATNGRLHEAMLSALGPAGGASGAVSPRGGAPRTPP